VWRSLLILNEGYVSVERSLVSPPFSHLDVDPEEIGVIAPYKAQVRFIREFLKQAKLSEISVGSVEQYQGQVCVNYMF
jgi:hypothetical protein